MDPQNVEQIGPYRVKRFIDEGAFAWVYEVADPKFAGRRLALKVLKPEAAAGEEFRRFEREAGLLAGMDHPSIVTIFDFGKDPESECFYYTMTFVDGPTLKTRLREGPLDVVEGCRLFVELLDGLSNLHEQGIIHRDIKPANVLIGRDGRGRLSDLGIARVETERSQTRTGVAVGTALYMSPEQARGRPVDPRSDLFSVGLTLYETLTGNVVYDHVDDIDSTSGMDVLIYIGRLDQQKDAEFSVVFPDQPEIPEAVKDVIRQACHLRADQRYATAIEMRDALRQALVAPSARVYAQNTVHWTWLAGGGGALAALLVGIAVWFLVIRPGIEADAANEHYQQTSVLEERSAQLVDAAKDLDPPPPEDLLTQVERRGERAAEYLFDGAEDLDVGNIGSAVANFKRADRTFNDACHLLASSFLSKRANHEQGRLAERARVMSEADAAAVAKGAWQTLEALLPKLGAPETTPEGCDGVDVHLARLAAVPEVDQAAETLDNAMKEIWPKLAEEAHQAAITARTVAETESVDAFEYTEALKDGKRFLFYAEEKQGLGDYRAAREQFRKSADSFRTAQAIIPAARARSQTRGLEADVRGTGQGIGGAVRIISKADELYAEQQWEGAAEAYRQATTELRGLRAEGEKRKATLQARALALTAQEAAVGAGAQHSAPSAFERAESTLASAADALENRRYDEAEAGFATAQEQYVQGQQEAIESIARARTKMAALDGVANILTGGRKCDSLGTGVARNECADAEVAMEAGRAALAETDAPKALRQFTEARQAFDRSKGAQLLWESTRPRPPKIVKRTPQRPQVEVSMNETRRFGVEAEDPNSGDVLTYAWNFDGAALRESTSEINWKAPRSGTLSVRVDDGSLEVAETWQVSVVNRPPRLSVSPGSDTVRMNINESKSFTAKASDPDGEEVKIEYKLGGRVVSRTDAYVFKPKTAGTYKLEISAIDSAGKRSLARRQIVVGGGKIAAVKPPTQPTKPPAVEASARLASLPDWRGDVVTALNRYADALESHKVRELERVLILGSNSPVRSFYERKFQRGEPQEVMLKLQGSVEGNGDTATVDFDQTERSASRTRTYRYRAYMIKRGSGDWQIERRERRR